MKVNLMGNLILNSKVFDGLKNENIINISRKKIKKKIKHFK